MISRINPGNSIAKALNYNEKKVQKGQAECIMENHFLKDVDQLNFHDKLNHFYRYTSLNERTKINTLHVSLSFDPSEKLTDDQLKEIAVTYMDKIGFGSQPFLVYRHQDTSVPHIHIVSTNIRHDGSRISMHNLGKNQSEKARKEIEIDFGLVKAQSKSKLNAQKIPPVNAQKVQYGKSETRQSIANVLSSVYEQYKYASLAEYNAVLRLYNTVADSGVKGSRMQNYGGLTYHALDEQGNKIGKPIKASSFFNSPTLKKLKQKFTENKPLKEAYRKRITTAIDWIILQQKPDMFTLLKTLEKEGISSVLWRNKEGNLYGITYIDTLKKVVFKGSDLGPPYGIRGISERCSPQQILNPVNQVLLNNNERNETEYEWNHMPGDKLQIVTSELITRLFAEEYGAGALPLDLRFDKKKKKRRRSI